MRVNIEILGPWLNNRGDELMLESVARQYGAGGRLGVSSNMGLEQLPGEPHLYKIKSSTSLRQMLDELRKGRFREIARHGRDNILLRVKSADDFFARGWMPERQIDMLLDSSGYAYGDPWSLHRMRSRADYYTRLRSRGTTIVILPQAFGPFEEPVKREAARDLFRQCDLIFARDETSRGHLEGLGLSHLGEIPIVPDITHLLEAKSPPDRAEWFERVAIVPNARMLDRTSEKVRDGYWAFIVDAMGMITRKGLEPVLIVHEANDDPLIEELAKAPNSNCRVIRGGALRLKGMLGAARGVISSRYHACISSLSQGTPTIGTSWNHKYELLFREYGCEKLLLSSNTSRETLEVAIDGFVDLTARKALADRLKPAAQRQKAEVGEMWARIDILLSEKNDQQAL